MKKFLAFALCVCTIFTLGLSLVQHLVQKEPDSIQVLSKVTFPGDRDGGEDEGICLL